MSSGPYYTTVTGQRRYYRAIGNSIALLHPHLEGKHIFPQLEALGLREEFNKGETPFSLPYSFTDYKEVDDVVSHQA